MTQKYKLQVKKLVKIQESERTVSSAIHANFKKHLLLGEFQKMRKILFVCERNVIMGPAAVAIFQHMGVRYFQEFT